MKSRFLPSFAVFLVGYLPAHTQSADLVSPGQAQAAFETEQKLVEQARVAAGQDDFISADRFLLSQEGLAYQIAPSVLVARRAAGVCGWLRNDGEYGRAMRVAERAVAYLAQMREVSASDRVERLYWEAVLRGDILDQKEAAVSLLQEADQLDPNDDRVLECELQFAQALAEFGR